MLQAHEVNTPRIKCHVPEWWVVTRPDGTQFTMFTSKEFMAEYYGKANWPYERKPDALGPQEPPQDIRIFNRRQADGSFRPLTDFFRPPA